MCAGYEVETQIYYVLDKNILYRNIKILKLEYIQLQAIIKIHVVLETSFQIF